MANPKLYAELNLPTCLVLSSEVVRSETYAEPTEILQEKRPAINLEAKSNGSVLAKDIIKWEIRSAKEEDTSKGFLPNLSDSFPKNGDAKNCIKENVEIYIVTRKGPAPNIFAWKGKTEIIIELNATTSRKM